MAYVSIDEIVEKMNLENLAPEISREGIKVRQTEVNRPALELTGYFDHFAAGRIQLIGLVEHSYIEQMNEEDERAAFEKLFSLDVPMVIFTRGLYPDDIIMEIGRKHGMPMFITNQATSPFMAEILRWLNVRLAPCLSIHGVLVDVYGIGVLLTGDSGIGKSEAAITKHFIELRGIGIIDVKTLFGVSSVRESQSIDMEIHLEEWDREQNYDRMGMEDKYTEYLGNKVVYYRVPVRPGRNVAIICESAAANHRQKLMGYNAAQELYRRVQENIMRRSREREEGEAED